MVPPDEKKVSADKELAFWMSSPSGKSVTEAYPHLSDNILK
jgi:hypothetical protein